MDDASNISVSEVKPPCALSGWGISGTHTGKLIAFFPNRSDDLRRAEHLARVCASALTLDNQMGSLRVTAVKLGP